MAKQYYDDLTQDQRAQLIKASKLLNERMRDMERKGLTSTVSYQTLSEWVANTPNKVDKKGNLRAVQTYKLTAKQAQRVLDLASNKRVTAGGEMKRAKNYLQTKRGIETPTREQITQQAIAYGELEQHVRSQLNALYKELASTEQFLTEKERFDAYDILSDDLTSEQEKQEKFDEWYNGLGRF